MRVSSFAPPGLLLLSHQTPGCAALARGYYPARLRRAGSPQKPGLRRVRAPNLGVKNQVHVECAPQISVSKTRSPSSARPKSRCQKPGLRQVRAPNLGVKNQVFVECAPQISVSKTRSTSSARPKSRCQKPGLRQVRAPNLGVKNQVSVKCAPQISVSKTRSTSSARPKSRCQKPGLRQVRAPEGRQIVAGGKPRSGAAPGRRMTNEEPWRGEGKSCESLVYAWP